MKAVNKVVFQDKPEWTQSKEIGVQNIPEFIYLRAERKMVKVFLDDILYIESLKDYIRIHLTGNKSLMVKQTISNIEEMLPYHLFVRIHRSFIVSILKITAYTQHDVEIGAIDIPIGRVYSQNLSNVLRKD
jgi:DNA-binding LytR/AlgR family response regulator